MPSEELDVYLGSLAGPTSINSAADKVPLLQNGALKMPTVALLLGRIPAPDPSPTDVGGTIDLTGTDGNAITITGTDDVTDIVLEEGRRVELNIQDGALFVYDATDLPIVGKQSVSTKPDDTLIAIGGAGDVGYIESIPTITGEPARLVVSASVLENDQVVNNTDILTNTDLTLTLSIGRWQIEMVLFANNIAMAFQVNVDQIGSMSDLKGLFALFAANGLPISGVIVNSPPFLLTDTSSIDTETSNLITFKGQLVLTDPTILTVQVAQRVADHSDTTLLAGSYFIATRLLTP